MACTGCQLEKLEFTFDDNKYDWCSDHAQVIIEDMSTFYWYKEGVYEHSAYYTNFYTFLGTLQTLPKSTFLTELAK